MSLRRAAPLLSLVVAAWAAGCGSGGNKASEPTGTGGTPDASGAVPDASAEASGTDPDDIDDDLPLPPAAGAAPTPPMGWNSWNTFSSTVNETVIEQTALAISTNGMAQAGYQYVNIDDGWGILFNGPDGNPQTTRMPDGTPLTDPTNFPNGIAPVAAYVHGLGLKLGIYSDRGTETCGSRVGSQGFETQDATSYAAWGVDYLKYDNCFAEYDPTTMAAQYLATMQTQYQTMAGALGATGQPFVFSLCAWSFYEWGIGTGSMWRTTTDITPTWSTTTAVGSVFGNFMANRYFAAYAGPFKYMAAPPAGSPPGTPSTADGVAYGWNDADMLEVGNGLSDIENQSHFSMWAIAAAPLIAGNDIRAMSLTTTGILTNPEVIAIDQDALGFQGFPVVMSSDQTQSIWAKPLNQSGARAVLLLNAGSTAANMGFALSDIGLAGGTATARDLANKADLGTFQDSYTSTNIPPHGSVLLKVLGTEPPRPHGTAFLSDLAWTYGANGLGLPHKDEADSTSQPVSGKPLSLQGTTYPKGIGADGPSLIVYRLAQKCQSFTATVGVDDAAGGNGSVVFQVWADGTKLFDSGIVTGTSAAQAVSVSLMNMRRLSLVVTNGDDGNAEDRADWASAQVVCDP